LCLGSADFATTSDKTPINSVDENPQEAEKAEILSGQLEGTHIHIPFASERDKKTVAVEDGKFVGGGNLGMLRQIYFGRFVSRPTAVVLDVGFAILI
jgi:hypothetical protein